MFRSYLYGQVNKAHAHILTLCVVQFLSVNVVAAQESADPSFVRCSGADDIVGAGDGAANTKHALKLRQVRSSISQGLRCQESGDYIAGARYFEQALGTIEEIVAKNDGARVKLLLLLGDAYTLGGDNRHAKVYLDEAVRLIDKDTGQREWLIVALGKLAEIHLSEKSYDNALRVLERAGLEDKQLAGPRSEVSVRIAYLTGLSQVSIGQVNRAKSTLNEAWTLHQTLRLPSSVLAVDILNTLSVAHQQLGEINEAAGALRLAVKHCSVAFGINSDEMVMALCDLGVVCAATCEFEEAERHLERSLSIARRLFGEESVETVRPLGNLSALLMNVGSFEKAERLCELRLSIAKRSFQDRPELIAQAHTYLGSALTWRADYTRARVHFSEATKLLASTGNAHPKILRGLLIATGVLDLNEGRYRESIQHFQRALQITESESGHETIQCLDLLARAYIRSADFSSAQQSLNTAFEAPGLTKSGQQMSHADLLITRASLLAATEQYEPAEQSAELAAKILKESAPLMHHSEARALMASARLHAHSGQYDSAEKEYSDALKIRILRFGADHPETAETTAELGALYFETGYFDKDTEYLSRALEIRQLKLGVGHPSTAESQFRLALLRYEEQQESALQLLESALRTDQEKLGNQHPTTIAVAKKLHDLQTRVKR